MNDDATKTSARQLRELPLKHIFILALLIVLGIASRFWFLDWPNFKPVAAIAIFCGFYFSRVSAGLVAAAVVMVGSDLLLGFSETTIHLTVYASILVAVLLGRIARKRLNESSLANQFVTLSAVSFLASCVFFLLTNAAVVFCGWYPFSIGGFLASYAAGLPFFKYTILGDLLFTMGIFSCFYCFKSAQCNKDITTVLGQIHLRRETN